jgi:sorbitol/mannitol transport system substrate-binding protein
MIMYRTDLFEEAGIEMPEAPSWDFVADAARQLTDRDAEQYGICLRGKAGWGENAGLITTIANSFGARWVDEDWNSTADSEEWLAALTFYNDLVGEAGPPGAANNGFNENLALFQQGRCAMWIDATVAASFVTNPDDSEVADSVGFALAPNSEGVEKRANWLWAWALAIPAGTQNVDAAKDFIEWATSKEYIELVAANEGWANVPPGARASLYETAEYQEVPFADMTLRSIQAADPSSPTVDPVPYTGIQFMAIPEWQGIGNQAGQEFSAMLAGQQSPEEALEKIDALLNEEMEAAGYR